MLLSFVRCITDFATCHMPQVPFFPKADEALHYKNQAKKPAGIIIMPSLDLTELSNKLFHFWVFSSSKRTHKHTHKYTHGEREERKDRGRETDDITT